MPRAPRSPRPSTRRPSRPSPRRRPDITINYGGGGSGKGRQDLADQVVDWAGTDGLIKDEDLAKFKGGEVLYFPTVLAPITVSYNLDGVDELAAHAGPRSRRSSSADQGGTTGDRRRQPEPLPDEDITVAVRSDGSGTTENFTKFLNAAVGDAGRPGSWRRARPSSGRPASRPATATPAWPRSSRTPTGAIGYVDLSDAKATGLTYASVKNKAGEFVEPTLEATSAAADGIEVKPDLTFFLGWADGAEAYPIAAQTWVIVYANQTDAAKGAALKASSSTCSDQARSWPPRSTSHRSATSLNEQAMAQLDNLQIP